VAAAATDAWQSARDGVVGLFRWAGRGRQERVAEWLDEDAEALGGASAAERDRLRGEVAAAWRVRLADLLAEFPEAADELRAWAERTQAALPAAGQSWVQHNTAGRDVYAVQHGTQVFYGDGERRAGG
jgi:hypothetical protein